MNLLELFLKLGYTKEEYEIISEEKEEIKEEKDIKEEIKEGKDNMLTHIIFFVLKSTKLVLIINKKSKTSFFL